MIIKKKKIYNIYMEFHGNINGFLEHKSQFISNNIELPIISGFRIKIKPNEYIVISAANNK